VSRQPTPETDAALIPVNGDYVVWHGLARRLERARDEAREARNECERQYQAKVEEVIRLMCDRDEAREDATNYYAKIGELQDELAEARKEAEYHKARYDVLKESW